MKVGLRRDKTDGLARIGLEFFDETGQRIGRIPVSEMQLPGPGAIGSLKTTIIKIPVQFNDVASTVVTLSDSDECIEVTLAPDAREPWNIAWDQSIPANACITPQEFSYSVYNKNKDLVDGVT